MKATKNAGRCTCGRPWETLDEAITCHATHGDPGKAKPKPRRRRCWNCRKLRPQGSMKRCRCEDDCIYWECRRSC